MVQKLWWASYWCFSINQGNVTKLDKQLLYLLTLTEEREKGEEGERKEITKELKTEERKEEGRKGGNHFNLRMFLMMQ